MAELPGHGLVVSGIGKRFGETRALDEVSFTVAPGEILALTGPSGSGKTTVCRVLAGLDETDAGMIALDGRDVTRMPAGRRRVAFMFESYALYPQLSVFDNVASPLRAPNAEARSGNLDEAILPMLELLEIAALAQRLPGELSGGQKQRVGLARALVQKPSLFLLDEPIAHLDAKLRHKLRGEIRLQLKERCCPTIWTTPDGLEALSVADRVAVIHNGRIEQIAVPDEIWLRPATLQVARLLGDPPMNLIPGRVSGGPDGSVFECASFSLPVPALSGLARGKEVVLGVRPDMIALHAPEARGTTTAEVYSHEPFGKYAIVTVRQAEGLIKIKSGSSDPLAIGAPVGLSIDPGTVTVFDALTERLVASAPSASG
jgi:multiple sugar transport system ATP-binding protein